MSRPVDLMAALEDSIAQAKAARRATDSVTALDDAIAQERHDRAAAIRAALAGLVRRPYTPGATVPYSFCTAHWVLADEGDEACDAAEPDDRCHMVALVTGDPL